jgi:hypothetical protein
MTRIFPFANRIQAMLLASIVLCCATSCSSPPRAYSPGERIPFGEADISVSAPELSEGPNGRLLAIPFYYDHKQGTAEQANALRSKFMRAFQLRDGAGKEYRVIPMTVPAYRALRYVPDNMQDLEALAADVAAPPDGRNWIALFPVVRGAHDFTLKIKGPSVTATIALGN